MSGGFFRGTSADQDTRFSNKQAKLMKSQKFAPDLEHLVDMRKVKMDVIRPWIANRVTELLGFEDEVLINFIYGLLDGKEVNGKEVQISLTGFMEKNTGKFMKELWALLLSAQKNESGVPQQFLDAKEEETRKKQAEVDRITNEIQKKKEKESKEIERERAKKVDGGTDTKASNAAMELDSKHMLSKGTSGNPEDDKEAEKGNGVRGRNSSDSPRMSRSLSNSRSYSGDRQKSRSLSRSPATRGRSMSSDRMSPKKRSSTPRRRHSPRSSLSPPRKRLSYYRQTSRSPLRQRSPSPVSRRRIRSPYRRRSPSLVHRRSPSPSRRRRSPSPIRRRRSPSPMHLRPRSPRRRRSPLAMRRRSPLPPRRRSLSPSRRKYQRSPSTPRQRSPPPIWHRSPLPARRRSPVPSRHRSPSPYESSSPSPVRHRSPSPLPARRRSPAPSRLRSPSPLPARRRSPAPSRLRSPSPVPARRRSPAPSHLRSPTSYGSSSPSPARRKSYSPVRKMSSKEIRRSPVQSPARRRTQEKLSPAPRQPSRSLTPPRRDRKDLRSKVRTLSPSPKRSPIRSESPFLTRNRSPGEYGRSSSSHESPVRQRGRVSNDGSTSPPRQPRDQKPHHQSSGNTRENKEIGRSREVGGDNKSRSVQKQSGLSSTISKQKDSPVKVDYKNERSPERVEGWQAIGSLNYPKKMESRKDQETKSERPSGREGYLKTVDGQESPTLYRDPLLRARQQPSYAGDGQKSDERNHSPLNSVRDSDRRHKSGTGPTLIEKVDHDVGGGTPDSFSEGSDKHRTDRKEKRKHKRSRRREVTSEDEYSSDSEIEERKEAKRRRREEKKLRKEERRRRREERRRRREERRAEKLKLKDHNHSNSSEDERVRKRASYLSDDEETQSEQQKLEIELRKKALESLKAKKGISH